MNARLICATLLIVSMGAIGCGAPQPPMACTEEAFPGWENGDFRLAYCEELDMVCNEGVTLADECPAFLEELEVYFRDVLIPELTERLERFPWEIDLEALAQSLNMSYSGFRAAFRKATGFSPRQYHLQIRINEAKELLANTSLSAGEIAAHVGFSSPYYFSRIFSKKVGASPTAYRRRLRA